MEINPSSTFKSGGILAIKKKKGKEKEKEGEREGEEEEKEEKGRRRVRRRSVVETLIFLLRFLGIPWKEYQWGPT